MQVLNLIGWAILVSSWIVPRFVENPTKKRLVGLALSGVSALIFIWIIRSNLGLTKPF